MGDQPKQPGQSPLPQPRGKALLGMNFGDALIAVTKGKRITRMSWRNPSHYGFIKDSFLTIHREGKDHTWMVNDGDILGEDWMILTEAKPKGVS